MGRVLATHNEGVKKAYRRYCTCQERAARSGHRDFPRDERFADSGWHKAKPDLLGDKSAGEKKTVAEALAELSLASGRTAPALKAPKRRNRPRQFIPPAA